MTSVFDTPFHTIGDWPDLVEAIAGQQPNHAAYQQVIQDGHAAITARVEPYQRALMANATDQLASLQAQAKAFRALADELRTVAELARDGELVDLNEYQSADNKAQRLVSSIREAPDRAAKTAADLVDPLRALDELEKRMPVLRQPAPTS